MIRRPPKSTLFPYPPLFGSEIKPVDFAKALEAEPAAVIAFEPQIFGTAANNGQMIAEVAANHRAAVPEICGSDRKSTRLNSSHTVISYAVFCLQKKTRRTEP